jgi:hypothetical protein
LAVEPSADTPAWPTSPFHGVIDGSGKRIPCRCRFRGEAYGLGETVCMATHLGVQLARCDLALNNTSWVPTGVPCTISHAPASPRLGLLSLHAMSRTRTARFDEAVGTMPPAAKG